MADIIFQPKGAGTDHKEGSIIINSPLAGAWGTANYVMEDYPLAVDGTPTGEINVKYSGRLDDVKYYV